VDVVAHLSCVKGLSEESEVEPSGAAHSKLRPQPNNIPRNLAIWSDSP